MPRKPNVWLLLLDGLVWAVAVFYLLCFSSSTGPEAIVVRLSVIHRGRHAPGPSAGEERKAKLSAPAVRALYGLLPVVRDLVLHPGEIRRGAVPTAGPAVLGHGGEIPAHRRIKIPSRSQEREGIFICSDCPESSQ